MTTWGDDVPAPEHAPLTWRDWVRVLRRGVPLGVVTFGCLAILLMFRLVERPVHGTVRPWTPRITQFVCRSAFRLIGMGHRVAGTPMAQPGCMVANHASWLDIFALNAPAPIYFVSKSEVAGWPGIGWLARATGTVFVVRQRGRAAEQRDLIATRLSQGHQLLFFPEGTSTDGRRVLPFKSSLFAALEPGSADQALYVQPVSVVYHAPNGQDPRFYGWWGDMGFGAHLVRVLAAPVQGRVEITYHDAVPLTRGQDRKALARAMETTVRAGVSRALADEAR